MKTYDAIIVGAGIVGAACALELSSAGLSVAVVERTVVASGATSAGMGHIVLMDDSPAQFALTSYSQILWDTLVPELPDSVQYQRTGTLWVAADEEEMAEVHRKFAFYSSRNIPVEILNSQALAEAEPNLRRPLAGALRIPSDAVLDPPTAAAYFLQKAAQGKCELILGQPVQHIGQGRVLLANGTVLHSPILINSTGAWAPELTPGLEIRKRKGHVILTGLHPGFVHHQLVELGYIKSASSSTGDSVAFNIQPRKTGQLLIGSSRQYDCENLGIDQHIVTAMTDRAALYMPALAAIPALHIRTGFRAATPDKLPLIGPTEDPTVFLATGHEGLGITSSITTARLLADRFLNRESAIPLGPYLPSRFAREDTYAKT